MSRWLTADNIHSAIMLLGVYVIIDLAVEANAPIISTLALIGLWVFAYYGLVQLLPEPWQP